MDSKYKMPEYIKKLADAMDKKGLTIAFGLEQQGHIPVVKKMLEKNKTWKQIGEKIGWIPDAAEKSYEEYLIRNPES